MKQVKLIRKETKKDNKTYTSYIISLPKDLIEALGWEKKEYLNIEVKTKEGKIYLEIS